MMAVCHLLSVGYDKSLMHSRTLVLRQAGFIVNEAFNLQSALSLVKSDSIDVMILCHTIFRQQQTRLISAVRKVREMLPIVCIECADYELSLEGCINAHKDPNEFLNIVKHAARANFTGANWRSLH